MTEFEVHRLVKMLETAIGAMVENEICSYCKILHNKDFRCKSGSYCADLIFDGLRESVRKHKVSNI